MSRRYHEIAPSKGHGAITKKQAEVERDKVLAKLNAPTTEEAVQQVAATGVVFLGEVARITRGVSRPRAANRKTNPRKRDVLSKAVHRSALGRFSAQSNPAKSNRRLAPPRSNLTGPGTECGAIMGRVYDHAEGHGLWEEGKRSPVSKAK